MENAPLEAHEHHEHAMHAAEHGDPVLNRVSVTIAVLAVFAATIGSLETIQSSDGFSLKNEALLYQTRASDQWSFFQAKSVKKNMYEIAAIEQPAHREEFDAQAKRNEKESEDIQKDAKELEAKSHEKLEHAEKSEARHHFLTIAATFTHVAIALGTIAIILRKQQWPWLSSLALGAIGLGISAYAFMI